MPLYEYRCKACGHRFEKIQSFSAPDEKECPVCHREVERLISAPAVQFKGSGFYSTDYAPKPSPSKASDGASKDGAQSTGDGSKDSSPAAAGDGGAKSSSGSDSSSSAPAASSTPAPSGKKE
jgi:putative FmdB family regulatory protein